LKKRVDGKIFGSQKAGTKKIQKTEEQEIKSFERFF
jgi:hypothetical protein